MFVSFDGHMDVVSFIDKVPVLKKLMNDVAPLHNHIFYIFVSVSFDGHKDVVSFVDSKVYSMNVLCTIQNKYATRTRSYCT